MNVIKGLGAPRYQFAGAVLKATNQNVKTLGDSGSKTCLPNSAPQTSEHDTSCNITDLIERRGLMTLQNDAIRRHPRPDMVTIFVQQS